MHTPGPWILMESASKNAWFIRVKNIELILIPNIEDARLVAAAPDLLEVCKECLSTIDLKECNEPWAIHLVKVLTKVIEKAEGDKPEVTMY